MRTWSSFDAVLFDVDGTLIDSNGAHATAWCRALREHGIAVDLDDVRHLIGMGSDKLLDRLAAVREDSNRARVFTRRKKEIFGTLLRELRPTPGARALVEALRAHGITLVIATSADDQEMDALLAQAGLDDLFPRRTSSDDAEHSKPDPDIVEAALRKAGTDPSRTVMIGDTPYDIEAARRAGIDCIALRCGGHWSEASLRGAIAVYDHPAELLDALR